MSLHTLRTVHSPWRPPFSYGQQILGVLANAGSSSGGDRISIYGYGLGEDPARLTVSLASWRRGGNSRPEFGFVLGHQRLGTGGHSAAYREVWNRPSSEWHSGEPSFLTGPALANAPFTGLPGGVDILDANTGRLRIILREPLPYGPRIAMAARKFSFVDGNGQRFLAWTASGLTVVELARVPLGFGSLAPSSGSGGSTMTIRGFQSGAAVTIGESRRRLRY